MNAVERDVLRAHVLAAVQSAPDDEPQRRAPLLAPFMTNATLLRVYNILAPLGVDERGGWPLQASLGRAVAALTGAPPPASMEDAQHWGNAMQRRVSHYSGRLRTKHSRPRSDAARNRLAADQEQLYICPYGGTPERPSESVLDAPLQPQPSPPPPRATSPNPVPTQPEPRGRTVFLEKGQMVMQADVVARLKAQAAAADGGIRDIASVAKRAAASCSAAADEAAAAGERKAEVEAKAAEQRAAAEKDARQKQQLLQKAEKELSALKSKLGSRITQLNLQLGRANAALEKARAALEKARTQAHAAATDAARQEVEEQHAAEQAEQRRLRASAHAEKRAWKKRAENAEERAAQRLARTKAAEARVEALQGDIEDLKEMLEAARSAHHSCGHPMRSESGRFLGYSPKLRIAAMAQLARGTPPSAVGANLVDAAHYLTPDGSSFREPSLSQMLESATRSSRSPTGTTPAPTPTRTPPRLVRTRLTTWWSRSSAASTTGSAAFAAWRRRRRRGWR